MEPLDVVDAHLPQEQLGRLDAEWATLSAIREVAGIALKGKKGVTYDDALRLGQELSPELFAPSNSLLIRQSESETTREYRQIAEAESRKQGISIDPLDLIDIDISKYEELVINTPHNDQLKTRLKGLYKAKMELTPNRYSENALIFSDAYKTNRELPYSDTGKNYKEFQIDQERVLRIRVLHPDAPEHAIGADVLYEHYWDKKSVVRLAAIQYKIWEDRRLTIDTRMYAQLGRLHTSFCDRGMCDMHETSKREKAFRLPYCTAFLRPTDRLQHTNSKLVSSGYHVPVCTIRRLIESPAKVRRIESSMFRSETVTHKVFEEMFNANMLGSGYLTYEELEQFYRETKILQAHERIIIHCQEYTHPA